MKGVSGPVCGLMARGLRYGELIHGIDPERPRASLAEKLGVGEKSLRKMYCDSKDGTTSHSGYIARGEWWDLYVVSAWYGEMRRE